jgi:hypothetical protein
MGWMDKSAHVQTWRGSYLLPVVFALLILFIQMGVSYYVSVQTFAMLFLSAILLHSGLAIRVTPLVVAICALFSTLLLVTTISHPEAISQNSPNILITAVGILGYAAFMLALVRMSPARPVWLLDFYRRSSATTIALIVLLVSVTDMGVFPGLSREYFIRQNVDLITNYTTLSVIEPDLIARQARGVKPDVDLFYGEQSFLSLVIFICLVSYVLSCRAMAAWLQSVSRPMSIPLICVGLACMIYIQSFSSMFYAMIVVGLAIIDVLVSARAIRLTSLKAAGFALLVLAVAFVLVETSPYYLHRIETFSDSVSAQQRFGILFDFLPQDFLFGLRSQDRMPAAGFHHGVIYLVMMAGVGGVALLAYLLSQVVRMARPLRLGALSLFSILAVFSQNGAIFSPNKLVVISLILVPLCSAKALRQGQWSLPPSIQLAGASAPEIDRKISEWSKQI